MSYRIIVYERGSGEDTASPIAQTNLLPVANKLLSRYRLIYYKVRVVDGDGEDVTSQVESSSGDTSALQATIAELQAKIAEYDTMLGGSY